MDVSPDETRVVTGAADGQIRLWRLSDAPASKAPGAAGPSGGAGAGGGAGGADSAAADDSEVAYLELVGSVPSLRRERCTEVHFSRDGAFVGYQAAGKGMEVFRLRGEDEARKRVARRKRRQREKARERSEKGGAAAVRWFTRTRALTHACVFLCFASCAGGSVCMCVVVAGSESLDQR